MQTPSLAGLTRSVAVCALALAAGAAADARADERPNFLLIVADDMGYSEIGPFGGEIETPRLDALAERGMRMTNFYVTPTCSPTRSMLLTGADNHLAGLGNMAEFVGPEQQGKPGYEGFLNERVLSVATVLQDAGYHTYMAGKWHLGEEPGQWPADKGFERDFTLLQGGGSNWSDMFYPNPAHPHVTFTLDGQLLDKLPEDHFSSQAYADFIIEATDTDKDDDQPFFAYLSFQAVHSPLAAPDDWLNRFSARYAAGYEAVRAERLQRMKDQGIVEGDVAPWPGLPMVPAWETLSEQEQALSARRMEIYAAMLANMDHNIGRVLDHLQAIGELDDTLVIFLSDNGAEPVEFSELVDKVFSPEAKEWVEQHIDMRPENWGRKGSVVDYGAAWAEAGTVPFSFFKGYVAEGGIRAPLIVAGPGVPPGEISQSLLHVTDIVPTLLDIADVTHPSTQEGSQLAPLAGKSMQPLLTGAASSVRSDSDWVGWELFGNRAVRQGDWKLRYILKAAGGAGDWELFNLRDDPAELNDLSAQDPARRDEMLKLWERYVDDNGVILTGDGPFRAP